MPTWKIAAALLACRLAHSEGYESNLRLLDPGTSREARCLPVIRGGISSSRFALPYDSRESVLRLTSGLRLWRNARATVPIDRTGAPVES